ncbi:MAG: aminopeptidase N, partial [Lysobacterales bacterium 13-68-4]
AGKAVRRLKRRVLELMALLAPETAHALATMQFHSAEGMTDRLAALAVLVRGGAANAPEALGNFRKRHADNPLAMDKWFAVQAQIPGEPALARVQLLEQDPAFTLKNPNRARALLGTFASGNPSGFHRPDGAGYRLLAERLATLDALNPQIAARLATAFNGWQRLEPVRREAARHALSDLAGRPGLSRNLSEIVASVLSR